MSYYFNTTLDMGFDEAVEAVTAALAAKGFGIMTTIDVKAAMKKKLGADMPSYTILGSCNPQYAHKALQAENKIGTMLPCNVVVQQLEDGRIEVSAVDPAASMQAIDNPQLASIAGDVRTMLQEIIAGL